MDFVHRHERRLKQHVARGTAKGIPNFFHILLTIGNLLLSQIERIVVAFESESRVQMDTDRWHRIREKLDAYYHTLGDLLDMTTMDYLDAMFATKRAANDAHALFAENLADLIKLYYQATDCRDKLDVLQQSRLIIVASGRDIERVLDN